MKWQFLLSCVFLTTEFLYSKTVVILEFTANSLNGDLCHCIWTHRPYMRETSEPPVTHK